MSNWDSVREDTVRKLWNQGMSASQIAGRLGGVTRNGVIGKVHRLGLSGRAGPRRSDVTRKLKAHRSRLKELMYGKPQKPVIDLPVQPLPSPAETDIPRVSFTKLEDGKHCKFPVLDHVAGPDVKQFCGDAPIPGQPYCNAHYRRCFDAPKPRRQPAPPHPEPIPTFDIHLAETA